MCADHRPMGDPGFEKWNNSNLISRDGRQWALNLGEYSSDYLWNAATPDTLYSNYGENTLWYTKSSRSDIVNKCGGDVFKGMTFAAVEKYVTRNN